MSFRTRMFTNILEDPSESIFEDDINFLGAKKKLLSTFDSLEPLHMAEHMKVYLRIRPVLEASEDEQCFKIENDHMLATCAPKDSHAYKNFSHGVGKTSHKFTFSKIFPQDTTQKELFDSAMLGLVQNFIKGQNCLVFTYGITSSGKTYTIQGKPRDAGILPRTLDVVFNSIDSQQCRAINHKPKRFMDVYKLSATEVEDEKAIKEKVLKMCTDDDQDVMTLLGEDASDMSVVNSTCSESSSAVDKLHKESSESSSDLFMDLENRVREETAVSVSDQSQMRFSVWVSFAEIYNEQIFDLLEPVSKKKNARRPILGLRADKNGSPYISGLKEICVTNADEAYKLLTVGQKNLKIACTKLNHSSSRSHCIFNIKIIRVKDCDNPHVAQVSMLSLCDLAGSERSSKTLATGDRLKEAGNINTSLMTLGRCIEILRYNQLHKEHPKIVPFRESKLTRLFQNFFSGRGKAAMIVNVNQCSTMFDETINVLKFSSIAKQVVVVQKPEPKPKVCAKPTSQGKACVRPSIPWEVPTPRTLRNLDRDLHLGQSVLLPDDGDDSDLEEPSQEIQELHEIIMDLERKLKVERNSKLSLEIEIRKEVTDEMLKQIIEIEDECSEQIREKEMEKEEMRVKLLLSSVNQRKRRRKDDVDDDDDEMVSSILLHSEQVKLEDCKKKNEEFEATIAKLNQEKIAIQFELADVKRTAQKTLEENVSLKDTIQEQDCKIKDLSEMLEEAAETFQEKEGEIARLKAAIEEDDEKLQQQVTAVRELRASLASTREAVEESQASISSKNRRLEHLEQQLLGAQDEIDNLKRQLEQDHKSQKSLEQDHKSQKSLEQDHKSQKSLERDHKSRKSLELDSIIEKKEKRLNELDKMMASKDQELEQVKLRLRREEEESSKRDKALIHGYTAEINTHKAQILTLKSKIVGLESKLRKEESARENLSRQIRALKGELDKTGLMSVEHEHETEITKSALDDLETRLQTESACHWQTKMELEIVKENMAKEMEHRLTAKEEELHGAFNKQQNELGIILAEKEKQLDEKLADWDGVVRQLEAMKQETEDIENQWKAASQQVKHLQALVDEEKSRHLAVKSKFEDKLKECEDLKMELSKASHTVEKLTEQLDEVKSRLEHFQKLLDDENSRHISVKSQLEDKLKECEQLKAELSNANCGVSEVKTKQRFFDDQLGDLKSRHAAVVADFENKLKDHQDLEVQLSEAHGVIEGMKLKEKSLTDQMSELKSVLDERISQNSELAQQCCQLKAELGKKEDEISWKNQATDSDRERQCKDLEDSRKQLEKELSECQDVISDRERQCKDLEDSKKQLDKELSECQDVVSDRERQCKDLENSKKQLEKELSECQNVISDRERQCKDLENSKKQLEKELSECQDVISDRKRQCKDLENSRKQIEKELSECQDVVSDRERQCKDLENSRNQMEKELSECQNVISDSEKWCKDLDDNTNHLEEELAECQATIKKNNEERERFIVKMSELEAMLKSCQREETDAAPGCSRKLRKEKIELELQLMNARHELNLLTSKLERATSSENAGACSRSPARQNNQQERLCQLERELAAKQSELDSKCGELVARQREVGSLQTELQAAWAAGGELAASERSSPTGHSSLSSSQPWLSNELQKSQAREGTLRHQLKQASSTLTDNIRTISELEESLSNKELANIELNDKLTALQEKSIELEKEKLDLEKQLFTSTEQLLQKEEEMQRWRQNRDELVGKLQTLLKSQAEEINQLKEKVRGLKEERRELQRQTENSLRVNETDISDLKSSSSQLHQQVATLQEKSIELEKEKLGLEKQLFTSAEQLLQKEEEMQRWRQNRDELVGKLQTLLKSQGEEINQLKEKVRGLKEERRELQRQTENSLRVNETDISDLKSSSSQLHQQVATLQEKLLEVEKQKTDLEKRLLSNNEQLSEKEKEMQEILLEVEKQKMVLDKRLLSNNNQLSEKEEEMQSWRQNRDELVGKLESLLKNQAAEIKELKEKVRRLKEETQEQQRQTGINLRANEAIICDLKNSNSQLQQQVAMLQHVQPGLPAPVFENDDVDTTGHINIDATPPSALKGLRKSVRKRGHAPEAAAPEQIEDSVERRSKRKAASIAKNKILNIASYSSPFRKSVAQVDETPELQKRGSKKRQLYKDKISAPFDCAPFMPSLAETPETVDVHAVVHRQLRTRGRARGADTAV